MIMLKNNIVLSYCYFSFVMVVLMPVLSRGQSGAMQLVIIGKQVWMDRDLDVSTFRNGNLIPEARTIDEWQKAGDNRQPAWCYYENIPSYAMVLNSASYIIGMLLMILGGYPPKDFIYPMTRSGLFFLIF